MGIVPALSFFLVLLAGVSHINIHDSWTLLERAAHVATALLLFTWIFLFVRGDQLTWKCGRLFLYGVVLTALIYFAVPKVT